MKKKVEKLATNVMRGVIIVGGPLCILGTVGVIRMAVKGHK